MSNKPKLILFLTVFIDLVGFGIIIPLSPYLSRQFGADAFEIGLLMAVYSAMQFLFSPFWGRISDRYGRRPIILMSVLGAGLSHIAFSFATTFYVLFIARMFAGVFAANISTAMASMADLSEDKDRSKAMGLIGAAFGLGFVVGPFLGGVLGVLGKTIGSAPPFGYSFASLIAGFICIANFIFAYKYLPETNKNLSKEEKSSEFPVIARVKNMTKYLRRPVVGTLIFMVFLSTFAMAQMESTLFLLVDDEFGLSLIQASMGFAYVGVIMAFTQGYLIRKLLPKYGERKLLIAGLSMAIIGLGGIAVCSEIWHLGVVMTFLALGTGFSTPSINGCISLLADPKEQGSVMGASQSLSSLARVLGPIIGGYFYKEISHAFPFWIAGVTALIPLILAIIIVKKLPDKSVASH